jgi:hypothetical protein
VLDEEQQTTPSQAQLACKRTAQLDSNNTAIVPALGSLEKHLTILALTLHLLT